MLKAIKSANKEDVVKIEKIILQVISDAHKKVDSKIVKKYKESVLRVVEKKEPDTSQHYVVTRNDDKEVIGYLGHRKCTKALLSFTYTAQPLEINALYVEKEEQNKGIGNQMIQYIRVQAGEKRYTEIILRSGIEFKESSWGFYEHLGFEYLDMVTDEDEHEYAVFRYRL
jgi:GNAT superfamily N-acetyltransferase